MCVFLPSTPEKVNFTVVCEPVGFQHRGALRIEISKEAADNFLKQKAELLYYKKQLGGINEKEIKRLESCQLVQDDFFDPGDFKVCKNYEI
jgi:hypothetical protein